MSMDSIINYAKRTTQTDFHTSLKIILLTQEKKIQYEMIKLFLFLNNFEITVIIDFMVKLYNDEMNQALSLINSLESRNHILNFWHFLKFFEINNSPLDLYLLNSGFESFYFINELKKVDIFLESINVFSKADRVFTVLNIFMQTMIGYFLCYENFNSWTTNLVDFFKDNNYRWVVVKFDQFFPTTWRQVDKIIINLISMITFINKESLNWDVAIFKFFKMKRKSYSTEDAAYYLSLLRYQTCLIYLPLMTDISILQKNKSFIGLCTRDKELLNFLSNRIDLLENSATQWYLIFNKIKFDKIDFFYAADGVYFSPQINIFNGDMIVTNIIDNKQFKFPFWIIKNDDLVNTNFQARSPFLSQRLDGLTEVLDSVNYLQSTKFTIDREQLEFIKKMIRKTIESGDNVWVRALSYLEVKNIEIEITEETINNSKILPRYLGSLENLPILKKKKITNPDTLSKLTPILEIIQQLEFILQTTKDGGFYLRHILDRRTRTYAACNLLNYQSYKTMRVLMNFFDDHDEEDNTFEIYFKFFRDYPHLFNYDIFYYQWLDKETLELVFSFLFIKYGVLFSKLNYQNSLNIRIRSLDDFLKHGKIVLLIEQACDIFYRLGGLFLKKDFNYAIKKGIELSQKIITLGDEELCDLTRTLVNNEKKFLEYLIFFRKFKSFWYSKSTWMDCCWYNDASSNVVQLLIFKLFANNNFLLQVANIFNNTTPYKDIYDYIAQTLKQELDFKLIDRTLIKLVIMPGAYGQKDVMLVQHINDYLKTKNEWTELEHASENKIFNQRSFTFATWSEMTREQKCKEMRGMIKIIADAAWKILKNLDFPVKDFLELVQELPELNEYCYFTNYAKMPIIIEKRKFKKTTDLMKKIQKIYIIKEKLNVIKELCEDNLNFLHYLEFKFEESNQNIEIFFLNLNIRDEYNAFTSLLKFKFEKNSWNVENLKKRFEIRDKKLKNQQKEDEKYQKRKNLRIVFYAYDLKNKTELVLVNKYIKKKNYILLDERDLHQLKRAISPALNHADDAAILHKNIRLHKKYKIKLTIVHDSKGTLLKYSLFSRLTFKMQSIDYIKFQLKDDRFPFGDLKNKNFEDSELDEKRKNFVKKWEANKDMFLKKLDHIQKGILESKDFFN